MYLAPCRAVLNIKYDVQLATYQTLRSTLNESNNRRRLCAGGKSFQRILHRDAEKLGFLSGELGHSLGADCKAEIDEASNRDDKFDAAEVSGLMWEEVGWRQTKVCSSVRPMQAGSAFSSCSVLLPPCE